MIKRGLRFVATAAVVIMVAGLAMLTPREAREGEATTLYFGDVPIAWDDAKPPNFWACLVNTSDPLIATEATELQAKLENLAGYGLPGPTTHIRVLANQDGTPGTADDPTWANIQKCIAFIQIRANPHDVAVFSIATHGVRACNLPVPNLVAGANFPDEVDNDWVPVDEPNEPAGDEAGTCVALGADDPQVAGGRDGWILTGIAANPGVPADWISDDSLAVTLAAGFRPDVGFIGIFSHCHSGEQRDGSADTHASLTAAGIPHSLLLSVAREHVCTGGFGTGHSEFADNFLPGLDPVVNAACATGFTRKADANAVVGNNDCVTTGVELFNYATIPPLLPNRPLANPADPHGAQPVSAHFGVWTDAKGVPAVGGVAELPEVAGMPLETDGSSGTSAGVLAGAIAGAVLVGGVSLGGAAWYARRRLARR